MTKILIKIEAEDNLLLTVGRRLLSEFNNKYELDGAPQKHRNAKSGIIADAPKWNNAANKGNIRLVLMDMDSLESRKYCPASAICDSLKKESQSENLLFRIAVYESESWLLADWDALKKFFGIKSDIHPNEVDNLENPKKWLKKIVKQHALPKFKKRVEKYAMEFVRTKWRPQEAAKNSKSLQRTLNRLEKFKKYNFKGLS